MFNSPQKDMEVRERAEKHYVSVICMPENCTAHIEFFDGERVITASLYDPHIGQVVLVLNKRMAKAVSDLCAQIIKD